METFHNLVTISATPDMAAFKFPPSSKVWGPYSAPAISTPGYSGSFEPVGEILYRSPVNPNGTSWSKILESGAIVMSNYEARSTSRRDYVAGREDCAVSFYWPNNYTSGSSGKCFGFRPLTFHLKWREQGDFRYWSDVVGMEVADPSDVSEDVAGKVSASQLSVVASFKGGYDLLTELAESKETFAFFRQQSGKVAGLVSRFFQEHGDVVQNAIRKKPSVTPKDLLKHADKAARRAGGGWMALRYAIMPLMYSYKDIAGVVDSHGNLYKTFRSSDSVDLGWSSELENGIHVVRSGEISIRSTVKAGYTRAGLHSLTANSIQVNPFATAYELIPLSFVLDWFVNFGDYIVANTSADFSSRHVGCTAIRTRATTRYYLRNQRSQLFYQTVNFNNPCHQGPFTQNYPFHTDTYELLREVVVDDYRRSVFETTDVSLGLNPSMNWKRWIDGVALSHTNLKSLIRKLKS